MGAELHKLLQSKSILSTTIPLLDWFSKSVKTCPTVVGETVKWNIHCYECDKIKHKEINDWGHMGSRMYEEIICHECFFKHMESLAREYRSIEQYEI